MPRRSFTRCADLFLLNKLKTYDDRFNILIILQNEDNNTWSWKQKQFRFTSSTPSQKARRFANELEAAGIVYIRSSYFRFKTFKFSNFRPQTTNVWKWFGSFRDNAKLRFENRLNGLNLGEANELIFCEHWKYSWNWNSNISWLGSATNVKSKKYHNEIESQTD